MAPLQLASSLDYGANLDRKLNKDASKNPDRHASPSISNFTRIPRVIKHRNPI